MQIMLIFKWIACCGNIDFAYAYGQRNVDQLCVTSLSIAQIGPEMKIICVSYQVALLDLSVVTIHVTRPQRQIHILHESAAATNRLSLTIQRLSMMRQDSRVND